MPLVRSLKAIIKQRRQALQALQAFWSEISHEGEDLERRRHNRLAPRQSEKFGCWPHRGIW